MQLDELIAEEKLTMRLFEEAVDSGGASGSGGPSGATLNATVATTEEQRVLLAKRFCIAGGPRVLPKLTGERTSAIYSQSGSDQKTRFMSNKRATRERGYRRAAKSAGFKMVFRPLVSKNDVEDRILGPAKRHQQREPAREPAKTDHRWRSLDDDDDRIWGPDKTHQQYPTMQIKTRGGASTTQKGSGDRRCPPQRDLTTQCERMQH